MTFATKYNPTVAWRTFAANVVQLTRETVQDAATYRVTVNAIDSNNIGAGQKEIGYYLVDYMGVPYLIIGIASTTIDVQDDFRVGRCPTSGMNAVVYKSVYNGRAQYLAPESFQHLHILALANSHRFDMAIVWANDPNAKRVPFTAAAFPGIINYQADQTDPEDPTKTINYKKDFDENPSVRLYEINGEGNWIPDMQSPKFTIINGLIDSIIWDKGFDMTGFIIISKS